LEAVFTANHANKRTVQDETQTKYNYKTNNAKNTYKLVKTKPTWFSCL